MVSIIIPYKEDRGYLSECLESIEKQTYPDIEVIQVHNDASVSVNVNIGLEKANGEFIKVVGEDDWLPDESIEDLVNGIQMQGRAWVCANAINVHGKTMTPEVPVLENLKFENMVNHNAIHNGGTMYRTEILREVGGYDESLWTGEEYDMHLKLMSLGYLPGYVPKFVYFYRIWDQSKSVRYRRINRPKRTAEIKRIQDKYR